MTLYRFIYSINQLGESERKQVITTEQGFYNENVPYWEGKGYTVKVHKIDVM